MAGDSDRQDDRRGPLDIFIMALYRVDKFGGGRTAWWGGEVCVWGCGWGARGSKAEERSVRVALVERKLDLQHALIFRTLCFSATSRSGTRTQQKAL